ncbi:MAG: MraY family glycosyltransferase [Saprospiraceae bacterium]
MPFLLLSYITAFTLTYLIIPAIIMVAKEKGLYDRPNERSVHREPIPSLGGIGIFGGAFCAIILWTPYGSFGVLQYILAGFMIVFLVGVKDDLMPLSASTKFLAQLLAAVILTYKSGVRITSFHGILGIHELPELSSFVLSVTAIIGIINAFNLIDGVDGLAGSIGLLTALLLGSWFAWAGYAELAVIGFALAGALTAFLKYNLTPAQVFMGDTGSLFIGLVCSILAIKFVEVQHLMHPSNELHFRSAPALAVSLLILPIFDTLRVFLLRILKGRSPFSPDKGHIHHVLLRYGLTHKQVVLCLVLATLTFVFLVILLDGLGPSKLLLIQLAIASICAWALDRYVPEKT